MKNPFWNIVNTCGLIILIVWASPGQQTRGDALDDYRINILEEYIENLEGAEEFDYNTLFETLAYFLEHPLNLNFASYDDLKELLILNEIQINDILRHRNELGLFISLYELQAIPSLDLKTIRDLIPFVTVDESVRDYFVSLDKMLAEGEHEIFMKWRRVLEKQRGYIEDPSGETPYIGDPNRYYLRYRYHFERKLRFGFTAEKDPGENFFATPNKTGFDFYSFHFHLKDYNRRVKDLIAGDFSVSFGQGLILQNSFGANKSSYALNIKKGGRVFNSYTSINEINFYRGVAASLFLHESLELSLFGSHKKIDGTPVEPDTLTSDPEFQIFSSIVEDGYHRTTLEIEKENSVSQSTAGLQLAFHSKNTGISLNTLYERFDKFFENRLFPYNQFRFRGTELLNTSLSYSHQLKNIHFFGEMAVSDNWGFAQLHGALMGLNKDIDLAVLYRNYSKDYQSLNSNSFGETVGTNNEKGIYIGMQIRPDPSWTIFAYADVWRHNWLRFATDAPSTGNEYLIRINYYRRRELDFYFQYKVEHKQRNVAELTSRIDQLALTSLKRIRIHASYRLGTSWELRNRLEFSFSDNTVDRSKGILLYQDVIFRSIRSPFSFSGRIAFFDTDDFDSRIYAFENDLIYEFFIPFFQYRGIRTYLNTRYDVRRNMTLEFRISRTYLDNRDAIGSGLDIIDGNHKTELKAQVRITF